MGIRTIAPVCVLLSLSCGDREEAGATNTTPGLTTTTTTTMGTDGVTTDDTGPEIYDVGDSGGNTTGGNTTGGDGTCPCKDVNDGIYVLNSNSPPSVWFFYPPDNSFTEIGVLGCNPGASWTSNSMAIDRNGYAWLNYYDLLSQTGKMFKAPLNDLQNCEELPYVQPAPQSWWLLGMGYAVVDADSSCDQLFVYQSDKYNDYPNFPPGGASLARYNELNNVLDIIGPTEWPVAELTGTGDGRLFAFAAVSQSQAVLVNLDKNTGAEIELTDLNLDITNAFAFAFWGGDVYFFTEGDSPLATTSKVWKLDYDGNEGGGLTTYNDDAGIRIPGAGVSTCASFTPPG